MRLHLMLCLGLVILFAGAWALREPLARATPPDTWQPPRKPFPPRFELQGAGSCAAQACHNADALTGYQGREYRISLERDFTAERPRALDKHAQAYAVLFDERSKRIVRQWKGLAPGSDVKPQREALCLRCHVHPEIDDIDPKLVRHVDGVAQFRLEDGVSCEACHGPAERWLAAHFRPGWKELSPQARAERGMRDTRSVLQRVSLCVDCHVGRAGMEVNHDLIAAGHPWLRFEFADYHARWHKHFNAAKDKDLRVDARGKPDFEARLWLVGQVASARAALTLLAERARDEKRPWPELAEHDCFACHHELSASGSPAKAGAKLGAPAWNAWHTAALSGALGDEELARVEKPLSELSRLMGTWHPKRGEVIAHAEQAALVLEAWLARWEQREPERVPVDDHIRRLLSKPVGDQWTEAAARHRALAAMDRARSDQRQPPAAWSKSLPQLEKLLRWPPGFDSPRGYDPAAVEKLMKGLESSIHP